MPESNGRPVPPAASEPLACSDWARSQHLDPVGSAGFYEGFLLVEQPLPWPFDVASLPELVDVATVAASARLRLQAVVPVGGQNTGTLSPTGPGRTAGPAVAPSAEDEESRRLICYRSARPGWAGPLVRSERVVEAGALAETAAELVDGGSLAVEGAGTGAGHGDGQAQMADVLVCTHGRRDSCCGARGMDLVNELRRDPRFGSAAGVRLWRTSHTGGHRFAPTAVLLPSATMWAWAGPELLRAAAFAEGDVEPWLDHYRGCATVGSPQQQAVERAVLAEVGWAFMNAFRRASDASDGVVRLEAEPGGTWEADVQEGRHVAQPDCRTPAELATKQSVEWVVEGLRQVVPA
jgi:hypothetical protein